jgi:predicted acylesterase/phospholipase RssA
VIWNMGAIAEAGDLDLFRDVMLASAAIPGAFPPVAIEVEAGGARYEELHVDGGVTHSVVLGPAGTTRFLPAPRISRCGGASMSSRTTRCCGPIARRAAPRRHRDCARSAR